MSADLNQTETIIRFSRRQLWGVLSLMFLFALSYPVYRFYPDRANGIAALYCVFIVFGAVSMSRVQWGSRATRRAIAVMEDDELRKLAYAKAFRNGFFVQLLYPAVCAFTLISLGIPDPWTLVVGSSTWLGFVTFLASVLWYDR